MKNTKRSTSTFKWASLPFVFCSAVIMGSSATAAPGASQQYKDARQTSSANYDYVGGNTQAGFGITDQGDLSVDVNQVFSEDANSSTSGGVWAGVDLTGDDKGIKGRGVNINHNWVSRDKRGQATHVNKAFGAYDRSEAGHGKVTVGYGQETENVFWEGRVSKGISDRQDGQVIGGTTVESKSYDYGVGASVGTFLKDSNVRVRAGLDHEWGTDVGAGESTAKNTTFSAGVEKFIQGTGHSVGLDVAASKQSGGYGDGGDTNLSGKLNYRYDFAGASAYQPNKRFKRVRVEVPGKAAAPRYAKKAQYKRVPIYKTVPTYAKKNVRTPYKQLVKSTMGLEGQTFFKLNSSKLIPSAKHRLKQIATQIRSNGYKGSIRITGNTCGLGDAAYDQRLSEQRAKSVRDYLVKSGFNAKDLIARGLGKTHPKYKNIPGEGFKNRRVDIEYVSEKKIYKTAYKNTQKNVQTGTRKVASGFKNVPAGFKNVMISGGKAGKPRVIWKTEAIATTPSWIKRALHNNINHNTSVGTYQTTAGNVVAAAAIRDFKEISCNTNPVTIDVLANDTNVVSIESVSQPQYGTAVIVNNKIVYTPNGSGCGKVDTFTYTTVDANGNPSTATVSVTQNGTPINQAPVAQNDLDKTTQGTAVTINALANDTDADGDALSISSFTQGANGVVTKVNGKLVYTPKAGFVGVDMFTYTIIDGKGGSDTATVKITVEAGAAANKAPDAKDDVKKTATGVPVTINVLGNDTDPDGDALSISSFTQGANGVVTKVNGKLVYTPKAGFVGADTFTYTISDGKGGTDTAIVRIIVEGAANNAPVANNDLEWTEEGEAVTINVLVNDTDVDGDTLSVSSFTQGSNGVVTKVNGKLVYTPRAGFVGDDIFTYTITDGKGGSSTATVKVTIEAGGACGICLKAEADDASTAEGQALTINVLANDAGVNLSITSVDSAGHGITKIVGNKISYVPDPGYVGSDSFWYDVKDASGATDSALIFIDVTKDGCNVCNGDKIYVAR